MKYTFYKDGRTVQTENLSEFCREHGLRRSHVADVASGHKRSYKGWSKIDPDTPTPINRVYEDDDDDPNGRNSTTLEQTLKLAEIATKAQNDTEYEKLVMGRIAKLRKGEPLSVYVEE